MRAILVVLDSVGCGALPDAADWGDAGTNTLVHTAERCGGLRMPHCQALGLGNILPVPGVPPVQAPLACRGRMMLRSQGKDTVTGHWELAGIHLPKAFQTFPQGFPREVLDPIEAAAGGAVYCNAPASGTEVIERFGAQHLETGRPILYTSGDSVLQLACHEDIWPIERLYGLCELAYDVVLPWRVARVIARPFEGQPGAFKRTTRRKDFAVPPPSATVMDHALAAGHEVTGVGKIKNIYGERGFSRSLKAGDNEGILNALLQAVDTQPGGFIFANLVDFDMLYGHRRDPLGYGQALEHFDRRLPELLSRLGPQDLLILTADHGNDPTHVGTDHTREYVPLLAMRGAGGGGVDLGTRAQLADVGATVAALLGSAETGFGVSFLDQLP